MLVQALKSIAVLAFLAVLAGMPTQAFAHTGHVVAASGSHEVPVSPLQSAGVETQADQQTPVVTASEPDRRNSSCPDGACGCCACGCASCHYSALSGPSLPALPVIAHRIDVQGIADAIRPSVHSSVEQPPKSFV